ncbi:MAG: hypothetical protein JSV83_13605 [Desulfobacterales bacterium]|nr:MAG: hypothetical protein JSV83_13605 [Desulfobacterales bacterium]
MKLRLFLIVLVATLGLTGKAMAGITVGTYDVTGEWSEFLVGGQGGQAGNFVLAGGPDWALLANLIPPPNPATTPWSWDTTYKDGTLVLGAAGPWDADAFATNVTLRVLSTGYDDQAGTLAWKMRGWGALDTGNRFTIRATYGTPDAPGTPGILPVGADATMTDDLTSAQISINPIPTPGAVLLGSMGVGLVSWLRRRKTL